MKSVYWEEFNEAKDKESSETIPKEIPPIDDSSPEQEEVKQDVAEEDEDNLCPKGGGNHGVLYYESTTNLTSRHGKCPFILHAWHF